MALSAMRTFSGALTYPSAYPVSRLPRSTYSTGIRCSPHQGRLAISASWSNESTGSVRNAPGSLSLVFSALTTTRTLRAGLSRSATRTRQRGVEGEGDE